MKKKKKSLCRQASWKAMIIIRQFKDNGYHKVSSLFPFKCPIVKKRYTLLPAAHKEGKKKSIFIVKNIWSTK